MARLTFESVQKYANECSYTVEKKSKGYLLNGVQVPTLARVIEIIKNGDLLDGECEALRNVEIGIAEIEKYCIDYVYYVNYSNRVQQPNFKYYGLAFDSSFYEYELTDIAIKAGESAYSVNSALALPAMIDYCLPKLLFKLKSQDGDTTANIIDETPVAEIDCKTEVAEIVNRVNDVWDKFNPKDDGIDTIVKIAQALSVLNNDCRDDDWHDRPVKMPTDKGFWEYAYQCFEKYKVKEECKILLNKHGIRYHQRFESAMWLGDVISRKFGYQKRFWWQDAHKAMTDIQYWNTVKELLTA